MRLWVYLFPPYPLFSLSSLSKIGDANVVVAKDDSDAIDQSNIIGGRTRGVKPSGGYAEPGDEEGLPGAEDGTSSTR